jgi:hypothetical protein
LKINLRAGRHLLLATELLCQRPLPSNVALARKDAQLLHAQKSLAAALKLGAIVVFLFSLPVLPSMTSLRQ